MDKDEQDRVRDVVEEILAVADMKEVSEKQVRGMASKKTGIDLSASREWRKFVLKVIKKFMEVHAVDTSDAEGDELETAPVENNRNKPGSSKKMKQTQETMEIEEKICDEDAEGEDEHESEEEVVGGIAEKQKYQTDEEGNTIICELSVKRKVVVSQFRGKTLVSLREYYEKDGKVLPSSKGISLTAEQFEVLAKSAEKIKAAISFMQ